MKKEMIINLIMISFIILSVNSVNAAYDMTQGSDWKWAYAQTHVNDSLSRWQINSQDIDFARMRVAASYEDCANIGDNDKSSQWCQWAEEDNATLERMLKAQAMPSDNSSKNIFQTAWDAIKKFFGV